MDGAQYKMPDARRDGLEAQEEKRRRRRTPGQSSGNGPALENHYGDQNGENAAALDEQQPLTEPQRRHVERMYRLYSEFAGQIADERARIETCRRIHELHDPAAAEHEPQLPVLLSTVQNKMADQMDNMPEAVLTPESPEMQDYAEDATDIVRWVFERNEIDGLYYQLVEDFYVTGTAIMQVHWDEDMDGGEGGIRIMRVPVDTVTWDPTARDIQSCRVIFKTAFHPRGWYIDHYPEAGRYVQPDEYDDLHRPTMASDQDVMLLEAWWRDYDPDMEMYRIHVCHMAGHVLLYDSRDEMPEGVYAHGMYPFATTTYREQMGSLMGRSCIEDYVELNRYANRNAKYIDWATRFAARPKLMLSNSMELRDESEITDAEKQIVHIDGMITGNNISWMPTPGVPPMAYQMQQWYLDTIKQESGQNQFARGEGGLGITAASAIQSLQEAGAKSSRMESQRLSNMYREAVEQVLWLIAQFFDPPRIIMITGKQDSPFAAQAIVAGRDQITRAADLHPAYRVNLQIKKRNPLRLESENQLILQMYEMSLKSEAPIPIETVLELLQVDGKERIMPRIREAAEQRAAQMAAQDQAAMAQADAEQSRAQLNQVRAGMLQDAATSLNSDPTQSIYG